MLPLHMKSLIEISISKEDFQDIVNQYESDGFEYLTSKPSDTKDEIIAVFRVDKNSLEYQSPKNSNAFIEFEDGTRSPLYIKRNRDFWED